MQSELSTSDSAQIRGHRQNRKNITDKAFKYNLIEKARKIW